MTLEQSLDNSNNCNIATNHNMSGWSTAQKMANSSNHDLMMLKKAEMEHSNAIHVQSLSNQSMLDNLNDNRLLSKLILVAGANKLLNLETEDSVAAGELLKKSANSEMLSVLSQLSGGSIANKTAAATVPETGIAAQLANYNALNAQNYQNQAASSALANALTAASVALAGIVNKTHYNVPPVGTTPIEKPVQGQI